MKKRTKKSKSSPKTQQLPLRIRGQIYRYGKPWDQLSENRQWYERHKTRSRGRPVNAYIPFPRDPPCYGNWEEDACGVCGQQYENYNGGINYDDGIQLMLEYARKENVQGGGYRSRGAVLYAMAVLKRQSFFMRHELGCCMPVGEMRDLEVGPQDFNFFPYPKIVWYLIQYGDQDKRSKKNIQEAQLIEQAIRTKIRTGATQLKDFQELKKKIRTLENKYHYRDWWRAMTREHKGIFFNYPLEEFIGESLWDETPDYDTVEDEFPF